MKIFEREISEYTLLNEYAEKACAVLFGGSNDKNIPVCELKQSFEMSENIYNRSLTDLSIKDAFEAYKAAVSSLCPECVILHLGSADIDSFLEEKDELVNFYRKLIEYIKKCDKKTRIAVVSLSDEAHASTIAEINKVLKNMADSEKVDYVDITKLRAFSAVSLKSVASFLYTAGLQFNGRMPIYDMVRILYGYKLKGEKVKETTPVIRMNPSFNQA